MKNNSHWVGLFFLLIFLRASGALGRQQDTLVVHHNNESPIVDQYLWMTGSDLPLGLKQVAFELPASAFYRIDPRTGFSDKLKTKRHYWLKLLIRNDARADTLVYLQFHSQVVDVATAYLLGPDERFSIIGQTGTDMPFASRVYPSYDMVFPISLKSAQTKNIVVQFDTQDGDELHLLPELTSSKDFKAAEQHYYLVTGLISGLMLTVFILNLFLWVGLRDRIHVLYALYILSALYEIFSMVGADIQFLYPNWYFLSGLLQDASPCVLGILMTLIMQRFLDHRNRPSIFRLPARIGLGLIIGVAVICVLLSLFQEARYWNGLAEQVFAIILFLQCLLFLFCAGERILQGYTPAYFYLGAIFIFDIGLLQFIWMVLFGTNQEAVLNTYPNLIECGIAVETIVVFIGIVYKYTRTERELASQEAKLLVSIVEAEEAERARLSADLHDDVGGTLGALSGRLSDTGLKPTLQELLHLIAEARVQADGAYHDVRAIAHNLAPEAFAEDGLIKSIEKKLLILNAQKKTQFFMNSSGDDAQLSKEVALSIYRIVNEILSNVSRHAVAASAYLELHINARGIELTVEDDGIGFDPKHLTSSGMGLRNIRNRAAFLKGTVQIDSNAKGTFFNIQIPFKHDN